MTVTKRPRRMSAVATARICRDTVFGGAFVTVNSTVVEDGERIRSVGGLVNIIVSLLLFGRFECPVLPHQG